MVWSHSTRASWLRAKPPFRPQTMEWLQLRTGVAARHPRHTAHHGAAFFARDHMHGAVGIDQGEAGGIGKGRSQMPGRGAVMGRLGLDRQPVGLAESGGGHKAKRKRGEHEILLFHVGVPDSFCWRRPCAARGPGVNRQCATLYMCALQKFCGGYCQKLRALRREPVRRHFEMRELKTRRDRAADQGVVAQ